MSLNSIDIATMLPRTVEAANAQGRELNQTQHALQQTAVQFEARTEREARQTVESQKSETEEYDAEEGSSGGGAGSSNRRKKKKNTEEAPVAPRSNSSFDIMV
ncbi:MAG: hypothetical protein J1F02_03285 [Lachnospiraceae bacterium]|nr:hypothetical protein [Lachnospiraceae bacterium]